MADRLCKLPGLQAKNYKEMGETVPSAAGKLRLCSGKWKKRKPGTRKSEVVIYA